MLTTTFQAALRRYTQPPFTDVVIELTSGFRFLVTHPDGVQVADDLILIIDTDRTTHLFDASSVLRLFVVFGRDEDREEFEIPE